VSKVEQEAQLLQDAAGCLVSLNILLSHSR